MIAVARRFIEELRQTSFDPALTPYHPLWIEGVNATEALLTRMCEQIGKASDAIERNAMVGAITEAIGPGEGTLFERAHKFSELRKYWSDA
jgi:hypothetical protein